MTPGDLASRPAVSVVIATHGRASVLDDALEALDHQSRDDVEVVVVDDDSPDDTEAVVGQHRARYVRVTRRGPGRARDVGWRAAKAPVVAFTDDDCVAHAHWVEQLVAPIESGRMDVVQGRTVPNPDHRDRAGPWSRTQSIDGPNELYQTCNIAYRREVLERLGGFRPEFSGPSTAGEDTDLGWRAREAGYRIGFAPDALVHHAIWPGSFLDSVRGAGRRAMVIQVIRHHPASRRLAWHPYVYRASHARAMGLIGAGVVVMATRPRLLPVGVVGVAVIGVIRRRHSHPWWRAAFVALGGHVVDIAEVAAFARASVRYRRLLL